MESGSGATILVLPPPAEEKKKTCSKCHNDKVLSAFRTAKDRPDGKSNTCYDCYNNSPAIVKSKRAYATTVNGRFNKAKWVARDRGFEFTLTLDQYVALVSQPCYYCNGKLGSETRRGVGLDRLRNEIGCVLGNVVSCCGCCNRLKSDWMTPEEAIAAVRAILRVRGQE